jgi:simple sugar transport system ATP-binding protein
MSDAAANVEAPPAEPAREADVVLEIQDLKKSFGPLSVLRGVDLKLHRGEVLGLVGDNGAGKSTLMKILSGFYPQDSGRILIEGQPVSFKSVTDSRRHGIEAVYQDLALIPQLPVYLNLFLDHELTRLGPIKLLDKKKMRDVSRRYLDEINVRIPNVNSEVASLSGGQRQAIAVARATRLDEKILLLDEPLAAMGARESRLIIELVQGLARQRSVSMMIIDHNFAHLFELCDRVNIIQGGRITMDRLVKDTSLEELTELMVSSYRSELRAISQS